jgi:hypothetical protein
MTSPATSAVVKEMLDRLDRLLPTAPPPPPGIPPSNVTLERVSDKVVGLGNLRGAEPVAGIGTHLLRGGRLDARVRFQLWGTGPAQLDDAMQALHTGLLENGDSLRAGGFLSVAAAETGLAEPVGTIGAWRKATSVDVLYEFVVAQGDDADALLSTIRVTTGQEAGVEREDITDEFARWDDEAAVPLRVTGPRHIVRLSALAFVSALPAAGLGGTVTIRRSSGTGAPPASRPDMAAFLAAAAGPAPAEPDAELVLAPADLLDQLGATTRTLALGDWDGDGRADEYAGFDRALDPPIELRTAAEHVEISYRPPVPPPAGQPPALDTTAVLYLRINQP